MKAIQLSKHKRTTRLTTWLVVGILGVIAAVGAGGVFMALLPPSYVKVPFSYWERAFLGGFGSVICGVYGLCIAKFARRILAVRTIYLYEGGELEIITTKGEKLSARLREHAEHLIVAPEGLCVKLKIGKRHFAIDSVEFSDGVRVKEFIARYLLEKS